MRVFFLTSFLCFLFSICSLAQTPTPTPAETPKDDGEVVKIRTNLIQIDVVVTGKNGKQITDLKPEDFEVLENGKKQEITNFSYITVGPRAAAAETSAPNAAQPKTAAVDKPAVPLVPGKLKPAQVGRTIALVVDDLGLSFQSMIYVRAALKRFVDEFMQPDDLVAIIRTAGDMGALQQFTSDKRQLYAAIERVRWYPLGRAGIGAYSSAGQTASENQSQRETFTAGTLGALNYTINGMRELPGRKAIILLSDGFDLPTTDEEGGVDESGEILEALQFLADTANRASVVINTVDARGLAVTRSGASLAEASSALAAIQPSSSSTGQSYNTQEGMISLAEQTGGRAFYNNNDIKGSIQRILDDQKGYYLIGYQPDDSTFDPNTRRFNKLAVRVNRPGAKVNYRSGFFGVADETFSPSADQTPQQQLMAALMSPFGAGGIDLRLNSLFVNDAKNGSFIRSLLHVQPRNVKFTDEPDGSGKKAVFDILVYTFGDNGVPVDTISKTYTLVVKPDFYQQMLDKGFVYNINLPVKKPGAYQLRIAIRDAQGGALGAANQFVEVPDLEKDHLALSGIILQSLTQEQFQQLARGQSLLVERNKAEGFDPRTAVDLRTFRRDMVLQYTCTIYNAKLDAAAGGGTRLETQTRIFHGNQLVFEGKSLPLDTKGQADSKRLNFNGAMALPPDLEPGDYVLQIIVKDALAPAKRQVAAQWIDFEIIK